MGKQGEARSLVGVAFEAYLKAEKAQERANAAASDLKRWTRELNEVEKVEFEAQVDAYRQQQQRERARE